MTDNAIQRETLFAFDSECFRTKEESAKNKSDKDILEKKFLRLNYERSKLEQETRQAMINLKNADREIILFQKQQAEDKKQYETLTRDKNILARANENLKEQVRAFEHDIMVHDVSQKKLERELNNSIYRENELRKEIDNIEKERDKCNFQMRELVEKVSK